MKNPFFIIFLFMFLNSCGGGTADTGTEENVSNLISECTLPYVDSYPESYLGPHEIPEKLHILNSSISKRSISFKDYFGGNAFKITGEKNLNGEPIWSGCTQDEFSKKIYTETLTKMKEAGANLAWIYNYAPWVDDKAEILEISVENYQIADEMIKWITREANGMGIEIYFAWQFWGIDKDQDVIYEMGSIPDIPMLKKIMDAHEINIINQASVAQTAGITGIAADWNAMSICFCGETSEILKEYYIARLSGIIDKVKEVFSGQVLVGQIGSIFNDERIFSKADGLYLSITGNHIMKISEEENINLTPDMIRLATFSYLQYEYEKMYCEDLQPCWHGTSSKRLPVMINFSAQSRSDYWVKGWTEDGFCISGSLDDGTTDECIQNYYTTDFSAQAIGMEGMLQAINQQSYFEIMGVDVHTGYWLTDTLIPGEEGFPNLSQSIRGKPAEEIVKYWYTGLQ